MFYILAFFLLPKFSVQKESVFILFYKILHIRQRSDYVYCCYVPELHWFCVVIGSNVVQDR